MALTLYSHPLASYCWKVLIALYEKALPFQACMINLGDPAERARFEAIWPTAKIPLRDDSGIIVPETSIIIEHLERYPGNARLIPTAPQAQLEVRLWDRLLRRRVHQSESRLENSVTLWGALFELDGIPGSDHQVTHGRSVDQELSPGVSIRTFSALSSKRSKSKEKRSGF